MSAQPLDLAPNPAGEVGDGLRERVVQLAYASQAIAQAAYQRRMQAKQPAAHENITVVDGGRSTVVDTSTVREQVADESAATAHLIGYSSNARHLQDDPDTPAREDVRGDVASDRWRTMAAHQQAAFTPATPARRTSAATTTAMRGPEAVRRVMVPR